MTAKRGIEKPAKPRPDFPLYAHANGQWCKSYGGQKYGCRPWDDPAAAEREWLEVKARLDKGQPAKVIEFLRYGLLSSSEVSRSSMSGRMKSRFAVHLAAAAT